MKKGIHILKQKMSQSNHAAKDPESNRNDIISFDSILEEIGQFGRYQIINGIFTCLVIAISSNALFNFVFSDIEPDHR